MWKMKDIMKNSNGDIEFEIIDDGLRNGKWHVSANGTDEEAENKAKQKCMADTFLEDEERLKCIKEQVGDVIKAEEDCKQNGTPFIDAYKEARKQSVKERIEELAETDGLRTENCSCGSNNKAEKTMAKMAIIYDFIDSLRDDLTIAEVKRRFF